MNNVKSFEEIRDRIVLIGRYVLPKGSNDPDPEKAMLASLGCIRDTQEWLETKIAYLDPTDEEGLIDWAQYIIKKALVSPTTKDSLIGLDMLSKVKGEKQWQE